MAASGVLSKNSGHSSATTDKQLAMKFSPDFKRVRKALMGPTTLQAAEISDGLVDHAKIHYPGMGRSTAP